MHRRRHPPRRHPDGHTLLAHNEDATAGWADFAYVVKAEPHAAPAFAALTDAGLASVGNARSARDAHPGIPKLCQYRRALLQPTLDAAIRVATDPRRAFGNNHLFATADGDIVDVEVSGHHSALLPAANRPLAHANHFTSPALTHLDRDDDLQDSRLRQTRVERLVDTAWPTLTPATLQTIMADHANDPASVCKHHTPDSDLDDGTIAAVVIDATTRTLWACAGNPCRSPWRQVRL